MLVDVFQLDVDVHIWFRWRTGHAGFAELRCRQHGGGKSVDEARSAAGVVADYPDDAGVGLRVLPCAALVARAERGDLSRWRHILPLDGSGSLAAEHDDRAAEVPAGSRRAVAHHLARSVGQPVQPGHRGPAHMARRHGPPRIHPRHVPRALVPVHMDWMLHRHQVSGPRTSGIG